MVPVARLQMRTIQALTPTIYFHTCWAAVNVDPIVKDGGTIVHREFNKSTRR